MVAVIAAVTIAPCPNIHHIITYGRNMFQDLPLQSTTSKHSFNHLFFFFSLIVVLHAVENLLFLLRDCEENCNRLCQHVSYMIYGLEHIRIVCALQIKNFLLINILTASFNAFVSETMLHNNYAVLFVVNRGSLRFCSSAFMKL